MEPTFEVVVTAVACHVDDVASPIPVSVAAKVPSTGKQNVDAVNANAKNKDAAKAIRGWLLVNSRPVAVDKPTAAADAEKAHD